MAYSYTLPSYVEAELRSSTAFSSSTTPTLTTVQRWIEEVSAQINTEFNRVFGATQYEEYIDLDGQDNIYLKNAPIISVDTFEYNNNPIGSTQGTDWETKTEDTHYTVYEDRGYIAILTNRFRPTDGKKRVRITYTAGYATTPETVQMLCTKMVTQKILDSLLNSETEDGNFGGSVSVGSINIVEPSDYGTTRYRKLYEDIESLKKQIGTDNVVLRYSG